MRVRVADSRSLFHGEEGVILSTFPDRDEANPWHLVALDSRGFGEHALGLSFRDSDLQVVRNAESSKESR